MPDQSAADLSNVYVPTGTHTYVHKNDDNSTGEMNQIRQICSAQGRAQQTALVIMKSFLVGHMRTELAGILEIVIVVTAQNVDQTFLGSGARMKQQA